MKKQIKYQDVKIALSRANILVQNPLEELDSLLYEQWEMQSILVLEYVPVKIIAYLEEYYRQVYAEIIDNPKFRQDVKNALKNLSNINLDIDFISDLSFDWLSMGDYLSYFFSCNNLNDIHDALSKLLNINFLEKLKQRLLAEDEDVSLFFKDIEKTFEYRHICCHEHSAVKLISIEEVMNLVHSAKIMVDMTNAIIIELETDDCGGTQSEMNEYANKLLNNAENELNELIEKIQNATKSDDFYPVNFSWIEGWKNYRKARAESDSANYEGGSIYPLIYATSMEDTTKELIRSLRVQYRKLLQNS